MDIVLRIVAAGLSLIVLAYFFLSLARTAIINRPAKDPILNFVKSLAYFLVQGLRRNRELAGSGERLFAWYMPIFIISLIVTWFLLVLVAFASLYWVVGAESTLRGALISSGSALTTLGFDTPTTLQGEVLGIMEGAIGLMIMVFMLSFIPGYQAAVQARELQVAWLHRRLGSRPTGLAVLLLLQQNSAEADRDSFWSTWETWFRQLQATHVLAPEVIYTPSVFAGQSWISCTSALLDAAAIQIAAVDTRAAGAPRICAEEGIDAVRNISKAIGCTPDAPPPSTPHVTRDQFADVLRELAASGIKLCCDESSAWDRFAAARAQYEYPLQYLSARTLTQDYLEFLPVAPSR
ncbi:MAG: hypothetical protein U0X20_30965 [Caldilineaceae bacterium]